MTWFAQSANETATTSDYQFFLAASFDFTGTDARFWTGTGDITINGQVYSGLGELARVSSPDETSNLVVEKRTYQVAGEQINPALISESDLEASFGRSVTEYLGFINTATGQLVATPEINFEGEISSCKRRDGKEPAFEVNAENRLTIIDKADGWRYTHEHQQQFFAGDLGFDQAHTMGTKQISWGGYAVGGAPGRNRPGPRRRILPV